MIDSFLWGFGFGIPSLIITLWGFLLVYIPIFYLYNCFIDRNAIYVEGFLRYYFLGYAIVFILFECYIALYVPFDYRFFDENNAIYYPIQQKYAEYNDTFAFFVPTYLIGTPIALYLTKLVNKLYKINEAPHTLHRSKTIIFGILTSSGLLLTAFVVEEFLKLLKWLSF